MEMITTITPLPYFYTATPVIDVIYFNQTLKNEQATLQIVYVPISHFCTSADQSGVIFYLQNWQKISLSYYTSHIPGDWKQYLETEKITNTFYVK